MAVISKGKKYLEQHERLPLGTSAVLARRKKNMEGTKAAGKKEFKILAEMCLKCVITKQTSFLIKFPYFIRFQKGFPKGTMVDRTTTYKTYKIRVRALYEWLYKKGFIELPYMEFSLLLAGAKRELTYLIRAVEAPTENVVKEPQKVDVEEENVV